MSSDGVAPCVAVAVAVAKLGGRPGGGCDMEMFQVFFFSDFEMV